MKKNKGIGMFKRFFALLLGIVMIFGVTSAMTTLAVEYDDTYEIVNVSVWRQGAGGVWDGGSIVAVNSTLTGDGNGIFGQIRMGETITLRATPDDGWEFDFWGSYDSGWNILSTREEYTFTVSQALMSLPGSISITGWFKPKQAQNQQSTITVVADPPQGGTVTGGGTFNQGDLVKLQATPNSSWVFDRWYIWNYATNSWEEGEGWGTDPTFPILDFTAFGTGSPRYGARFIQEPVAHDEITVIVNGELVLFNEPKPFIHDGIDFVYAASPYVPVDPVLKKLGIKAFWNNSRQTITYERNGILCEVTSGNHMMKVGTKNIEAYPQWQGTSLMLPLKPFAESIGVDVSWDADKRRIEFTDKADLKQKQQFIITHIAVPSNGGTAIGGGVYTGDVHDKFSMIAEPNSGWVFDGWYVNSELIGKSGNDLNNFLSGLKNDITIEARFSQTTSTTTGNQLGGFQGEPISAGVKFKWNPQSNGVGYRIYRSENPNEESISITDFYITSNEFVDVNVRPNTTYYYYVRQVIKEAKPFEGLREELGPASNVITVTTLGSLLGGNIMPPAQGATKKFILMTIDDPWMSINGIKQEIDPGRGTTPLILNSRTMVPIRAIVEGMGGTVGWEESTRKISLDYEKYGVHMWLLQYDIMANGISKKMDVLPNTINGRTMVPIRFSAENLGSEVDWLNSTRQVVIVYY